MWTTEEIEEIVKPCILRESHESDTVVLVAELLVSLACRRRDSEPHDVGSEQATASFSNDVRN